MRFETRDKRVKTGYWGQEIGEGRQKRGESYRRRKTGDRRLETEIVSRRWETGDMNLEM